MALYDDRIVALDKKVKYYRRYGWNYDEKLYRQLKTVPNNYKAHASRILGKLLREENPLLLKTQEIRLFQGSYRNVFIYTPTSKSLTITTKQALEYRELKRKAAKYDLEFVLPTVYHTRKGFEEYLKFLRIKYSDESIRDNDNRFIQNLVKSITYYSPELYELVVNKIATMGREWLLKTLKNEDISYLIPVIYSSDQYELMENSRAILKAFKITANDKGKYYSPNELLDILNVPHIDGGD